MAFETILVDVTGGILTITLNRPDRMNAFTTAMMHEMVAAFDQADGDGQSGQLGREGRRRHPAGRSAADD